MDYATELPISGHNLEKHVTNALADAGYRKRAMQRAANIIRREWAGKPDDYHKYWNLVDAEILERMASA